LLVGADSFYFPSIFPSCWRVARKSKVGEDDFFNNELGWRQDNGNRFNQESKFDFLATHQRLVKIDEGQRKIKIVRTNRQSNLRASCQSIFSLSENHPNNEFIFKKFRRPKNS